MVPWLLRCVELVAVEYVGKNTTDGFNKTVYTVETREPERARLHRKGPMPKVEDYWSPKFKTNVDHRAKQQGVAPWIENDCKKS